MPYHLQKDGRGYVVITTSTGRRHSEKPISKSKAEAQLRLLESIKEKKNPNLTNRINSNSSVSFFPMSESSSLDVLLMEFENSFESVGRTTSNIVNQSEGMYR